MYFFVSSILCLLYAHSRHIIPSVCFLYWNPFLLFTILFVFNFCRNYRISVDDLDCALVSVVTPVRVDGVRGESFSTRSNPVSAKPPLFTSASLREDRVGYVEGGSVNVEVVYSGGKPGRHLFRYELYHVLNFFSSQL